METHRGFCNEVSNGDKLTGVGVDESLDPSTSLVILDLNDMRQHNGVVILDQEFEGGRMVIELAIESLLSSGNSLLEGDGGCRGRN